MFFLTQSRAFVVSSIILSCCTLILSTTSLHIENCKTNGVTTILERDPQNILMYNGRINAELSWNKTYGVALVKRVRFSGMTKHQSKRIKNFTLDISSLKAVRIQRLIEYNRDELKDIVKSQCSLGFIYDNSISLDIPHGLEDAVISHAEKCIEDKICKFDPENHRIGDDIHVKSTSRKQKYQTTSQETVNAATDFVVNKLINELNKANKTLLTVPEFGVSALTVNFNTSGGVINILKYVKREGDLYFQYEGRRYVIDTLLSLIGGRSELHDVSVSSPLGDFVDGELPVNMTGGTLRLKVTLDYDQTPCKITVNDVKINIESDQVDFSSLKIKVLGFEVTNVDTILKTLFVKSLTINAIANKLGDLLKSQVEEFQCEEYRDLLFKLDGIV